jgi:hypothetical protein
VDLDEKMFGVAAPAVGPQLHELGAGVMPLAAGLIGQYGEIGRMCSSTACFTTR